MRDALPSSSRIRGKVTTVGGGNHTWYAYPAIFILAFHIAVFFFEGTYFQTNRFMYWKFIIGKENLAAICSVLAAVFDDRLTRALYPQERIDMVPS